MLNIKYKLSYLKHTKAFLEASFLSIDLDYILIPTCVLILLRTIKGQYWLAPLTLGLLLFMSWITYERGECQTTINESQIIDKTSKKEIIIEITKVKFAKKTKLFYIFFINAGEAISVPLSELKKEEIETIDNIIKKNKFEDKYFKKTYNFLFIVNLFSFLIGMYIAGYIATIMNYKTNNINISYFSALGLIIAVLISIFTLINAIKGLKKYQYKKNLIISIIFIVTYLFIFISLITTI